MPSNPSSHPSSSYNPGIGSRRAQQHQLSEMQRQVCDPPPPIYINPSPYYSLPLGLQRQVTPLPSPLTL